MARTLNNEIKKNGGRRKRNGRGPMKVKLSDIRKRRSSIENLRRRADRYPRAAVMDSSDDDSQGPIGGTARPSMPVPPPRNQEAVANRTATWSFSGSGPLPATRDWRRKKEHKMVAKEHKNSASTNDGSTPETAIELDSDDEATTSKGTSPNPIEVTDSSVPTEESNSDFEEPSLTIRRQNLAKQKRKRGNSPEADNVDAKLLDSQQDRKMAAKQSSKDRTAKAGENRCHYVAQNNRGCRFVAVNGTNNCYMHSKSNGSSRATLESQSLNTESVNSNSLNVDDGVERPYNHKEYMDLWFEAEDTFGVNTDEIENTKLVRGANYKVSPSDSDGQSKAQYGRLLPGAMGKIIHNILEVKPHDVFLDIGHGIGNAPLQAAFTAGCEARGVELIEDRQSIAAAFRDYLKMKAEEDDGKRIVGKVDLRYGRLEDPEHHKFLTDGVTRAYVNNFNGVFAERSMKPNTKWFLDDYVAGIFASMAPGARLVTLHQINLGPTLAEANKRRRDHNLSESDNASFYEVDKLLLGTACDSVKWNQVTGNKNSIYVYMYQKLRQRGQPEGKTVFLCCNPTCRFAQESIPIDAVTKNEEGRYVMNTCSCKVSTKNLRRQGRKTYTFA